MGGGEDERRNATSLYNLLGLLALHAACQGVDTDFKRLLKAQLKLVIENLLSSNPKQCREPLGVFKIDKQKLIEAFLERIEKSLSDTELAGNIEKISERLVGIAHEVVGELSKLGECKPNARLRELIINPVIDDVERFDKLQDVIRALLSTGTVSLIIAPRGATVVLTAASLQLPKEHLVKILKEHLSDLEHLLGREYVEKLLTTVEAGEAREAGGKARVAQYTLSALRDFIIEATYSNAQFYLEVKRGSNVERRVADWNQIPSVFMDIARSLGVELDLEIIECMRRRIYQEAQKKRGPVQFKLTDLLEACRGG